MLESVSSAVFPAFSAEFPNDNSALHLGTIWMCESVCGPPEAHFPEPPTHHGEDVSEIAETVEIEETESIEIVDSIVLEGPIEIVPPPPLESSEVLVTPRADLNDPEIEDAREAEPIEAVVNENVARLVSTPPPPIRDPFEAFLQTLSDVACDSGQTYAASEIAAALSGDAVAAAWQAILNGESEDFSLCATPLDEWASLALARVLSAPHKAAQFRRELRARGVAAFGLIEAA
jgi:hypothetical protein